MKLNTIAYVVVRRTPPILNKKNWTFYIASDPNTTESDHWDCVETYRFTYDLLHKFESYREAIRHCFYELAEDKGNRGHSYYVEQLEYNTDDRIIDSRIVYRYIAGVDKKPANPDDDFECDGL